MTIITTSVEIIEMQLRGGAVTTPIEFRPEKDGAVLDFELPSRRLSFRFVLTGHTLRLVARDMRNEGVTLSNILLHDFRESGEAHPVLELGAK